MANANLSPQFNEPGEPVPAREPLRVVSDETPQAVAGGLARRAVANFIDSMISAIVLLPLNILVMFVGGAGLSAAHNLHAMASPTYLVAMLAKWVGAMAFTLFYYGYFYKTKGATPGKQLMGLKVVDAGTGTYLSYGKTFARETVGKGLFILSMVPLFIGFFLAVFRKDKRCVHDFICDTQVLRYDR